MRIDDRREGVTMVLVAILVTVLLGMGAMAVDLSRLTVAKSQLQTVADAAALAGVLEVAHNSGVSARDSALAYAARNGVEASFISIPADSVQTGEWDFAGNFLPLPPSDSRVNAVRVAAPFTASLTLGRVFGRQEQNVRAVAVAAVASVTSAKCLKPFAFPYEAMLHMLGHGAMGASYDLQQSDIDALRRMMLADGLVLKKGADTKDVNGGFVPGNFQLVDYPVVQHADGSTEPEKPRNGAGGVQENLEGCTGTNRYPVGVGDILQTEPGNKTGPVESGIRTLCGTTDGTCNVTVTAPIVLDPSKGGKAQVVVKYIGVFVITGYGTHGNEKGSIYGHFTSLVASGAVSPVPGPATRPVLVR